MTVTVAYKKGMKLSEEQIAEIEAAKAKPIVYDGRAGEQLRVFEAEIEVGCGNRNRYKKEIS